MTTPTGPTAAAIASPGACRLLLLLAIVAAHGAWGVQITELHVPPVVRNGSSSAVLDCEYSLRSDELRTDSGLVVKWYFNNGPSPVYQWIAGGRPQDLGVLRGRLDLLYRASDNNAMKHRALYIVWGSPLGEGVNVTCRGRGVYPEPKIALYVDQAEGRGRGGSRGWAVGGGAPARVSTTPRRAAAPSGPAAAAGGHRPDAAAAAAAAVDPGPALKSFIYYKGDNGAWERGAVSPRPPA
ncbi:Uncharacterized protein GBIM_16831 [Gryllus bimaculatus]|nr:Uncharacterized protein GBIM_16831 [Gryllus bimaculatus]